MTSAASVAAVLGALGAVLGAAYSLVHGYTKVVALVLLTAALLVLHGSTRRQRRVLLMMALLLSPISLSKTLLPYGMTISVSLLIVLSLSEALNRPQAARALHPSTPNAYLVLPFAAFALVGLVATTRNGEIAWWFPVCLLPAVLLWLAFRLVSDRRDCWTLIKVSCASIGVYVMLVLAARLAGAASTSGLAWRAGAIQVRLGPVSFDTYSVTFGTAVGIAAPALAVLVMRQRGRPGLTALYALALAGVAVLLLLSAARGASLGALVGILVVLVANARRARVVAFLSVVTTCIIAFLGALSLGVLPSLAARVTPNFQRITEGLGSPLENRTLQYRLTTLSETWAHPTRFPLGRGFAFLYNTRGIDESIVYSMLLNGTGILGFACFAWIVITLGVTLGKGFRAANTESRDLATLGLATLLDGLVTGVTTHSILTGQVQAAAWWGILIACVLGLRRQPQADSQ